MFAKVKVNPIHWVQDKLFGRMIDEAWQLGFDKGSSRARKEMEMMLRRYLDEGSLEDFKSDELKLGYRVAQGIVTDVLDGKR